MATRLQSVASTEAMRNYAVGFYSDSARTQAQIDAEFLTGPGIAVSSDFEFQSFAPGDSITIPNSLTSINNPVGTRVTYGGTKVPAQLDQHRVTSEPFYVGPRISDTDLLMKLEDNARSTMMGLIRGRIDRIFSAALTAAGAATPINVASTSTNAVDIVQQVLETVELNSQGSGQLRILFGSSAFRKFCNHVSVQNRVNGGATRQNPATVTEQQVADLLGGNVEVRRSRAIKNGAQIGQTPAAAFTLADSILVAAVSSIPSTSDPSAIKLFVGRGDNDFQPKYRLAYANDSDFEEATWGWAEKIVATNSAAVKRLDITIA